jgi:signal transduction histidine kinase
MTGRLSKTGIAYVVLAFAFSAGVVMSLVQLHARIRVESRPYRADFSQSEDWLALGGAWTARLGEATNTSEERGAKLINRSVLLEDYQVDSDLLLDDLSGEAGLILRSSDEEEGVDSYHGYFAGIRPADRTLAFGRADFGWQPLAQKSLSASADLKQWVHLHAVAVGCKFGISVTFSDHSSTFMAASEPSCITSGRTGLRSSLISARWKNFQISRAGDEELWPFRQLFATRQNSPGESAGAAFTPEEIDRYVALTSIQARQRAVLPGVHLIHDFLTSPGRHPDVTIRGVVISNPPLVELQDDSGAIVVQDFQSEKPLKLGDVVEAQGAVVSERFRSRLEGAKIRVLWSDMPFPPLAVTASQLTGGTYRGRAITVEGTLISATSTPGGYELLLSDQNYVFRALGSDDFRTNFAALEPGSRLRLRGTATSIEKYTNNIYPFAVLTDRVEVLRPPPWWSARHMIWLLLFVCVSFVVAQYLLHLVQQWHLRSVLREREQLAFEMHDTLAQSFTGIAYQLQAASQEKRGEDQVQSHIHNALKMVHLSHKEASRTISSLRPQYRDAAAIVSSLRETAERLSDGGGLQIDATMKGRNSTLPLPITDAFFRIGQEAISNAIQHSQCQNLTILLNLSRREASLTIRDNGRGFVNGPKMRGLGMDGMRNRAIKAKAELEITSVPGAGTTILVRAARSITGGLIKTTRDILRAYTDRKDPPLSLESRHCSQTMINSNEDPRPHGR